MPKLNLDAKNETQKIIKEYLEKNVSDILADKINNGVRIQKDGTTLINKKTLARGYGSLCAACAMTMNAPAKQPAFTKTAD